LVNSETYHLEPGVSGVPGVDGQVVEVHPRVSHVVAALLIAPLALQAEPGLGCIKRSTFFTRLWFVACISSKVQS